MALEHEAGLVAVGEYMSGLKAEEITKVRGTQHGGIVVIDLEGHKHTYEREQYEKAVAQVTAGAQPGREKFETVEVKERRVAKEAEKKRKAKPKSDGGREG